MTDFSLGATPRFLRALAPFCLTLTLGLAMAGCQTTDQATLDPSVAAASESTPEPAPVPLNEAETARFTAAEPARSTRAARQGRAAQAQVEARYYVEFRARDAQTYGHTYVMFGQLGPNDQPLTKDIAGLHPASESAVPYTIGHFIPVQSETGPARGDGDDRYLLARHRIIVDKARYDEIVAVIREMQATSPSWHAVLYNCNAFIGDIARRIGLEAPGNSLALPQDYISELHRLNS